MLIHQMQIESLGNSSYIVGSQDAGVCAIVDPVRDVDIYIDKAQQLGMRITHTVETHVHNDFLSGSRELAARIGVTICASSASGLIFDHRAVNEGDSIELGEVRLEVIATPGHTPEHVSYLAFDAGSTTPSALFSGGALLVGGIARTDLLGDDVAPFLGRWFHHTIQDKLAPLPDDVDVYPTHGGGSFCLVTPEGSGASTTTIGNERAMNPFFSAVSEDEFVEIALSDLPPIPAYYSRMADINVRGPRILGGIPKVFPLTPREVWSRAQRDASIVDTRTTEMYAASHIPRSYSVPFGGSVGTWVGWLVPFESRLVLVVESEENLDATLRQMIRIGYDELEGYIIGMDAWNESGLPTSSFEMLSPRDAYTRMEGGDGPQPLDVRFGYEVRSGLVPGAIHVELGDLPSEASKLDLSKPYATFCAAGVRASTAASILERAGVSDVAVVAGGISAWDAAGLPLEVPDRTE